MARQDLKLSDEEFWELTPRQFKALIKRHERELEHKELLTGILASSTVNTSMCRPKTSTKPSDFMPSQWGVERPKKQRQRRPRIDRKAIADQMRIFLNARVGKDYK